MSLFDGSRKIAVGLLALTVSFGAWPALADETGSGPAKALERALVEAIAKAEKSVVAVARVRRAGAGGPLALESPEGPGRIPRLPSLPSPTDPDFMPNDYASGVVVDRRGLILTACQFLAPESDYFVTTFDRRVYHARVHAADPRSDLAVLAIDGANLPPMPMGDGGRLRKGQMVVALGNPFAVARDGRASASWGIVANLARKLPPLGDENLSAGRRTLHEFGTLIQTDVRLGQGTAGGALLNLDGEMIGLTLALATATGYESAAGYAIPIDATFRRVIDTLKEGREVEYGFLGIRPGNIAPTDAAAPRGVRVQSVVAGGPAQRDGLKSDDLITAVAGRVIETSDDLMLEVSRLPPESIARFSVLRGSRPTTVAVTLAKFPVSGFKVATSRPPLWRGLQVDYVTAVPESDRNEVMRRGGYVEGVAVVDVTEGSPAWRAGLRRGMIVSEVNGRPIQSPKQFRDALAQAAGPVELRSVGQDGQGQRTHDIGP